MAEGPAPHEFFQKSKIKSEDDDMSEGNHSHTFFLKYHNSGETYTIHCDHPQTVLEAISFKKDWKEKLKCEEQSLTVQIGEASLDTAIATHFPCHLLQDQDLIILAPTTEQVEQRGAFDRTVSHNERYYVLYIQTKGGTNSKTKTLLRSSSIKMFTQLRVYGTKGMTIKDAIARDGRFIELREFKLEDVSKTKSYVLSDDKIEAHKNKTFRICLERMTKAKVNTNPEKRSTGQKASEKDQAQDASKVPPRPEDSPKVIRLTEVLKRKEAKSEDVQEVYELLRQQFPNLKKILEDRYPGDTFEETLKKVDFGKAQQSFTDVFRLKKLLELGKSVGKLVVGNMSGTAFVLCHHYIITNAHLFKGVVYNNNDLDPNVKVYILFNYINPALQNTLRFTAHNMIDFDEEQDYAILELDVTDQDKVPPGLLKHFCPMPESGEACLIGHPDGDVQKIDPTCIIEKKSRSKQVNDHFQSFKDNMFTHMSVSHLIEKQNISRILSKSVSTYDTFMFHGSSGSPVFDAQCRVFGLHSGGFVYGMSPQIESVIEFSHPVLMIFEKFVTSLKNRNQNEVLRVMVEHSKRNFPLKKILKNILGSENPEEPMDTS